MSVNGIDPKVATGLPPGRGSSDEEKGIYTVSRFAVQNDHFVGHYKSWTKCVNFLIGEQWRSKWDGTSLTWGAERDIPPWHQQPVTNLVYAVYRSALAKLTKQKPTLEVVPKSGDSEDKEAAELCESVLTYLWRYLKKPQKVPVALGWMLVTGMAWVRVGWDPCAGESKPRTIPMQRKRQALGAPISQAMGASIVAEPEGEDAEDVDVAADENGEPYTTDDGSPDFDRAPDREPIGEICWDVISPLAVRTNPEATSMDDAYEMFVATLWPKKRAAKHFGLKEEDLGSSSDADEQRALYDDLMSATAAGFPRSWADQASTWGVSQQDAIGDRILVIEYYAKQDEDFPEGRHWISAGITKVWPPTSPKQAASSEHAGQPGDVAGGVDEYSDDSEPVFKDGEAPLPFGFWPPLVPLFDTPIPGQPTALGMVGQVVPLNEQLNMLDGKIAEKHVMDSMGGVTFASPEDQGMVITSEPGQIIYSKAMGRRGAAFAPFQQVQHPLPEAVYREREVITQKIMMVSSMSGIDMAQQPTGVTSGRALLVTQETSDSVIMPTLIAMEACLEECGRRELVIAQQKYSEERTIAIKGDDGQWLFQSFTRADLRSGHDVRVQVGSSFPFSKSAQWDARVAFLQAVPGLYTDMVTGKVDEAKLAKYMDVGVPGLGAFSSEEDPDLIEIQREHAMFEVYDPARGEQQIPQIAYWQKHDVHLQAHYDFMKKSYARYLRWAPAAQEAFKQHMQLTQVAVEDLAARMMPAAPPSPDAGEGGAPAGPGGQPSGVVGSIPPSAGPPPPTGVPGNQMRLNKGDYSAAARAGGSQ